MHEIPVVSVRSPTFAKDLVDACLTIGFVSVVDHGLEATQFDAMRELCRRVFDLDEATKQQWRITRDNYRGFVPLGFFTPNRADVTGVEADQYESFKLHWECPKDHPLRRESPLYGPNRWLPGLPEMRPTVLDYWSSCERVAAQLLGALAPALGVETEALSAFHDGGLTNMTLLHYPAQPPLAETTGIHAHKDTNVLTLLHPDPVGGLEVRANDGTWIDADAPPDALLVNTGEMLEIWSGGHMAATPHRVINRSGEQRYSFPWFLVPRHDVVVAPLQEPLNDVRYPPMPVGELSAEVWRTNWPDAAPASADFDLGSLSGPADS